jgi:hypothetical protein
MGKKKKDTVNDKQLAICKQRGHNARGILSPKDWSQCEFCGMWLREVRTIEERRDTPPEDEQSPFHRLMDVKKRKEKKP